MQATEASDFSVLSGGETGGHGPENSCLTGAGVLAVKMDSLGARCGFLRDHTALVLSDLWVPDIAWPP